MVRGVWSFHICFYWLLRNENAKTNLIEHCVTVISLMTKMMLIFAVEVSCQMVSDLMWFEFQKPFIVCNFLTLSNYKLSSLCCTAGLKDFSVWECLEWWWMCSWNRWGLNTRHDYWLIRNTTCSKSCWGAFLVRLVVQHQPSWICCFVFCFLLFNICGKVMFLQNKVVSVVLGWSSTTLFIQCGACSHAPCCLMSSCSDVSTLCSLLLGLQQCSSVCLRLSEDLQCPRDYVLLSSKFPSLRVREVSNQTFMCTWKFLYQRVNIDARFKLLILIGLSIAECAISRLLNWWALLFRVQTTWLPQPLVVTAAKAH